MSIKGSVPTPYSIKPMSEDAPNPLETVLPEESQPPPAEEGGGVPAPVIEPAEPVIGGGSVLKQALPPLRVSYSRRGEIPFGETTGVAKDSIVGLDPLTTEDRKKEFTVVRVLNIDTLLAEARKITTKTRLMYFFKNPEEDQLRKGPMGINILTYELKHSAVGKKTIPRFFAVMVSYFPEDASLIEYLIE